MNAAKPISRCTVSICAAVLLSTISCSKLKSAIGQGDEGGASSESPFGGNPLAILKGFEGEVDLTARGTATHDDAPVNFSIFVKSDKLRVDFPEKLKGAEALGGKGYGIYNVPEKKIYIVNDPQKVVTMIDLNKSGEQFKQFKPGPTHGSHPHGGETEKTEHPPKLTKTGKYDTVAGYKCENWDITTDHKEGTMCIAEEGFSWFSLPITGIPTEHAWVAEIMDGKHFPLRYIGYEKDGATESARIEVTKIDKRTLAPAMFEYPPTYRLVDLGLMMQGMMGGGFGGPGGMPPGAFGAPGHMPSGLPPGFMHPPKHNP